jgi:hypothetical protein
MHSVAIDSPGSRGWKVAVPDLVGVLRKLNAFEFGLSGVVKETKFNFGSMGRKERKIYAETIPSSP